MTTATPTPLERQVPRAWREALQAATDLALATYRDPEQQGRIHRGSALVLWGQVQMEEDGRCQVRSTTHPQRWHEVTVNTCACHDAKNSAPDGRCKHIYARALYLRAGDHLRKAAAPKPPHEEGPVSPEALFSLTLKGTIGGHEALLTARGQTWEAFAANVERVRGLFDQAADEPATAGSPTVPPASAAPMCKYHGKMKESTKAPGTWFCTRKLADGSYCDSRYPER